MQNLTHCHHNLRDIYLNLRPLIIAVILVSLFFVSTLCSSDIFSQYNEECRKIVNAMTIEQKLGQIIQADFEAVTDSTSSDPQKVIDKALGSLLISGISTPTQNGSLARIPDVTDLDAHLKAFISGTESNWKKFTDRFKDLGVDVTTSQGTKYKIKLLLASDAVHGDQHTLGRILFPHNVGLSCSRNPSHFENVGFWTKESMKKVGFNYAFAPTVAVSHNPQWGRFYETMGQDELLIEKYAEAYVKGLQDVSSGRINGVVGSAKHFLGDGSTLYGTNMGNAQVHNFTSFIPHNVKGYVGSVNSNVGTVMVSFNGINWVQNNLNSEFLLNLLRQDVGFRGFTITDYDDLELNKVITLPRTFITFKDSRSDGEVVASMLSAGVDMFMISSMEKVNNFIEGSKKYTEYGVIVKRRLDQAVTRVLTVKMAMGLVQKGNQQPRSKQPLKSYPQGSSQDEYQDSLSAVHESLVLLKNDNTIPARGLLSGIKYVVLLGENIETINRQTKIQLFPNYDNIGMQCGGWSVRWQGVMGNEYWSGENKAKTNASSILDALKSLQQQNNFEILYPQYTNTTSQLSILNDREKFITLLKGKRDGMNMRNTLIIGTFGEWPYAESDGDVNIPYCIQRREGCLYNPFSNPYAPSSERNSLLLRVEEYENSVISTIRERDRNIPMVSVILSGRPMLIDEIDKVSNSVLAAWLPGTSGGQGIVNAISGAYTLKPNSSGVNTLSMDWPRDMSSLSNFPVYGTDGKVPKIQNPLFSVGHGLSTANLAIVDQ